MPDIDEINRQLQEAAAASEQSVRFEGESPSSLCPRCGNPVPDIEIIEGRCAICREKERDAPDYSGMGRVVVCPTCGTRHDADDFCYTCYLRAQERAAGCQ